MPSTNEIRQQLLADFGDCVCTPDFCFDDPNGDGYCRPCARLDPYWECFAAEPEEDDGGPGAELDIPGVKVTLPDPVVTCRPTEEALAIIRDLHAQGVLELDGTVHIALPEGEK